MKSYLYANYIKIITHAFKQYKEPVNNLDWKHCVFTRLFILGLKHTQGEVSLYIEVFVN